MADFSQVLYYYNFNQVYNYFKWFSFQRGFGVLGFLGFGVLEQNKHQKDAHIKDNLKMIKWMVKENTK